MKTSMRSYTIPAGIIIAAALLISGILFLSAPKADAAIIEGNPGGASGGGGGSGWSTGNGHGWRLFDISHPTGPSGGFKDGSGWSNIVSRCAAGGANKVWAYVIRNGSGGERGYTFQNYFNYYGYTNYNDPSGRPWLDQPYPSSYSDPYEYNAAGNYDGIKRYNGSPNGTPNGIVGTVRAKYEAEGGSQAKWGHSVGWFCWTDNPPWNISVTSTANTSVAEIGDTITWTHKVTNSGPNKTNKEITWKYESSNGLPAGNGPDWKLANGTGSGGSATNTSTYTVQASDFGKRLCRSTKASPKSNISSDEIKSGDACVLIAKKPKVQVLGGDLSAGRAFVNGTAPAGSAIVTSQSMSAASPQKLYGSWGEYGLLATGVISGPGSGAALKDGLESSGSTCYNKLSFSNATTKQGCDATTYGNYTNATNIPDVAGRFKVTGTTPTYSGLSDAQFKRLEKATTDITIPGGTLQKGEWLVINAAGRTVTITGDITYTTDTLSSVGDIPQLVIIADRINIEASVKQVDAWLIANGTNGIINTCSKDGSTVFNPGAKLSGALCKDQLRVNGPVMAKKIYLYRTAGADAPNDQGSPAEIFNLRADAYLWAMGQSLQGVHVNIAETTELPPRF